MGMTRKITHVIFTKNRKCGKQTIYSKLYLEGMKYIITKYNEQMVLIFMYYMGSHIFKHYNETKIEKHKQCLD